MLVNCKTKQKAKQMISLLGTLMLLGSPDLLRAQWVQEEFVSGGWQGPRFDGSSNIAYEAKLQQMVDAGINLVFGNLSGFPPGSTQYQTNDPNDPDIVYQLSRIARVNQNNGHIVLRALVEDRRYGGRDVTALPADLDDYTVRLTTQQRDAQYGYTLADEPDENQLINKQNQVTRFRTLDPSRLAFINLFSNRIERFHGDPDRYRDYVRNLASVADVVSFDNYPFTTDGTNDFIREEYFQNYQIVAEESDIADVPFWAFPMAVEHLIADTNGKPRIEHDGPADYRIGLTKAHLRFMAYVPVLYGAKGINWYVYDTKCQTPTGCYGTPDQVVEGEAILDFLGNPTDSTNPVPNIGPIYDWVASINSQLRNMGPRLMNLRWLRTVHGSSVNDMGDTPILSYFHPTDHPVTSLETNLPTVGQNTQPIKNDFEDQFAIGIMESTASATYHLLILNKDLITPRIVNLVLDRDYAQYRHRKTVNSWRQLSGGSQQVSLTVQPGDIEMVRLELVSQPVSIDIKPGNKRNIINPHAKGGIWVAVLSDTDPESPFDPSSQVDIPTVEFGPDGAKAKRHKVKDINKDGLGDLLLRFKIQKTGIACGDTEATLTGKTFEDLNFIGTDSIKTVGCKSKKHHKKR